MSRFDFRGLRCVAASPDLRSWEYLPQRADLRRDAEGAPMVTMVDLGASGYLLFSATWSATDADLEALRREIASRIGEPHEGRVRLSFASVSAPRCHALIGDARGTFQTVAESATSGIPPYDAVFNLFLEHEQLARANAGLHGEPGLLAIEYLAGLGVTATAKATFHAAAIELLPWIRSQSAHREDLRRVLDEAVARGIAAVVVDAAEPQAGEIAIELYERVLDDVARAVPRWLDQGAGGDILATVALDHRIEEPVRAFADIGAMIATEARRPSSGGRHAAD